MLGANTSQADSLNIKASNISIDKKKKLTIFKGDVYAKDERNNEFKTQYAEYKKELKLLESEGKTTILTSEGFYLVGEDILFDNKNLKIKSIKPATIQDLEKNNIFLENFEYSTKDNFFKSIGKVKLVDSKNNSYSFSQIYIDEKRREIFGTDIKTFINQDSFKINKKNKPRIFANTLKIKEGVTILEKASLYKQKMINAHLQLQANKMKHDKKKTIYYDNAVLKVYDLPIFIS